MAQLNQSGTRGALREAAERLDRLARGVKDKQLSETRSGSRIALTDAYVASPEEAWAKKFMTQAIGPATGIHPAVALPPSIGVPEVHAAASGQRGEAVEVGAMAVRPGRGAGPIGVAIGKNVKRRSWLGRLFRR